MSDDDHIPTPRPDAAAPIPFAPPKRRRRGNREGRRAKPKVRKLRLLALLAGLGALAAVSTIFGMMMAVASDLPQLENKQQYKLEANSYLYDDHWRPIGLFAPPNHDVIDSYPEIGLTMRRAIVSVEDKRFWSEPGVDIRGIGRAFLADVTGKSTQGASTIAEQFVKNALTEENNRTVFEKLREAALAYHLTRKWSKAKILREYLNSIYFGHGAYGVESAARVYFGKQHGYEPSGASQTGCGDSTPTLKRPSCASELAPWEAALLAAMVANPSAFDPLAHPQAAMERRDLVLQDMVKMRWLTPAEYETDRFKPLPKSAGLEQPEEPPAAPYFTSWLAPQILDAVGHGLSPKLAEYRAYYGGLKIRTTIDLPMQQAAERAITNELPQGTGMPAASLVSIDNKTGQVRAMIGGPLVDGEQDYNQFPFNLATEGFRQPGSSFKPFTLTVALEHGYGPSSIFNSHPLDIIVPNSRGKEHFVVHNFGNTYSGAISLATATDVSDNTVFTQLGLSPGVGTKRVARIAKALGIRSPVSTNYSMILGGLKVGVTTLDMAHAYETFATGGLRVFTPGLGAPSEGPTGIAQIQCLAIACHGKRNLEAVPHTRRVIPAPVAATIHTMLQGVVATGGTATNAAISGVDVAGKTGTTQNYGDAWFVGWTPQLTTAVWVGYPNKLVPMTTLYNGAPVEGGTFPALIWRDYMEQALQIVNQEKAEFGPHPKSRKQSTGTGTGTPAATGTAATPPPSGATGTSPGTGTAPAAGAGTTPAGATGGGAGAGTTPAGGGAGTTPAGGGAGTTPAGGGAGTTPAGGTGGGGGSGGGGTGGAGIGGGG
jgi:penicillin-binding protein 1A